MGEVLKILETPHWNLCCFREFVLRQFRVWPCFWSLLKSRGVGIHVLSSAGFLVVVTSGL